jgi:hypothetical protein
MDDAWLAGNMQRVTVREGVILMYARTISAPAATIEAKTGSDAGCRRG